MTSPTPTPAASASPTDPMPTLAPPAPTTTTSSTPIPAPATTDAPAASAGGLTAAVLSAAVVAAIVSGLITTALARRVTQLQERARVRTTLAEAYQAYADYKEFPFAIRRRQDEHGGDERIRLSEELRQVQSRLSFHQAWTQAEDPTTGAAYNALVGQLRKVAGSSMHEAWLEPGVRNDADMNISGDRVNLGELRPAEETFLKAVEAHVKAITESRWRRIARYLHQRGSGDRSVSSAEQTSGSSTAGDGLGGGRQRQ